MRADDFNPRLYRVRMELRADGIRNEPTNPLRSGIHHRGYLPHVKREGALYFVTFRLEDSLPKEVLQRFLDEKAQRLRSLKSGKGEACISPHLTTPRNGVEEIDRDYQRKLERYLDKGVGACHLRRPDVATIVAEALTHFHGVQYLLDEWVIMPNHVHLIIWPMPCFNLSEILKGRKQFTATQANRLLGRTGKPFWQVESYDHWIRDDAEKLRTRRYIRFNPVKAGLCATAEDWQWGSAWSEQRHPKDSTNVSNRTEPQS